MGKNKMPKSIRKFIRQEKVRIRREILDVKEQEKQIQELYKKIFKPYADSRNLQPSNK